MRLTAPGLTAPRLTAQRLPAPRLIGLGLIALGLLTLGFGWTRLPAAVADQTPTIQFADDAALSIGLGESEVVVVNPTKSRRRIQASFVPDKSSRADAVQPVRAVTVPPLDARVLRVKAAADGSGYLVVTDGTTVIERRVEVSGNRLKPGVTSFKNTVSVWPWGQQEAAVGRLPLAVGQKCVTSQTESMALGRASNGKDDVTINGTCDGAALVLVATDLAGGVAGVYDGTITVGSTPVSIQITRQAPLGVAVGCLLLGLCLALLGRALVGRRGLKQARSEIEALTPPPRLAETPAGWLDCTEAADAPASTGAPRTPESPGAPGAQTAAAKVDLATAATEQTKNELRETVADGAIWARWQHPAIRWLFAPSTAAETTIAAVEVDTERAGETITRWASSSQLFTGFVEFTDRTHGSRLGRLGERAKQIRYDPKQAMSEPSDDLAVPAAARAGLPGLAALLDELQAITSVATLTARLEAVETALQTAPRPTSADRMFARRWIGARADARLAVTGLLAEIGRTVNAVALLQSDFLARVAAAMRAVDRLDLSAPRAPRAADTVPESGSDEEETGRWWQLWPSWLPGAWQRARTSVLTTDLIGVVGALIVVVCGGLALLYVGKGWGTPWDMLAAVVGAAAGTVVAAPLLDAVDRLSGRTVKIEDTP